MQRRVAHDGREQRRLADAVAAQHASVPPRRQFERDAVEHDGLAVAGAHAVEHDAHAASALMRARARRDRLRARADRRRSPRGVPSTRIAPCTSTVMRRAKRNTRSMSCSMISTAMSAGSCSITSMIDAALAPTARRPPARRAAAPWARARARRRSRPGAGGRRRVRAPSRSASSAMPSRSSSA